MKKIFTTVCIVMLGLPVVAHDGVQNEAVKARMMAMDAVKNNFGVLGGMARGKMAYDQAQAEQAMQELLTLSGQVPALFEANETDPKSEAAPAIWENWDDFVSKAEDLEFAVEGVETSSLEALQASVGNVGAACSACHKPYRIKK
jgi:cytochrome c556